MKRGIFGHRKKDSEDSEKTFEKKHREWLKQYEGLYFSIGENKKDMIYWKEEKDKYVYSDKRFGEPILCWDGRYRANPNKIQRHPRIFVCESDDPDKSRAKAFIELAKTKLESHGIGYIESSHGGKSNYLWINSSRDLSDDEVNKAIIWIIGDDSTADLNFANSNFRLPVLYAEHWKYPGKRELPVHRFEGSNFDFDRLGVVGTKVKKKVLRRPEGNYEITERKKQKVSFNFESEKSDVKNISELEPIIKQNFPSVWFETKACASLFASLSLKNLNGCPSLVLVGNPSGEKTTVESFFYNHPLSYVSDDFTPRAFVSHSANVKPEELEAVDLLPKIKNKVLISPELAPLFEAPKDKLLDNFSILTRVLDGEGLNRDSGVHGHRGYSGDYKFGWLGATTPLKASVWNIMGKIGNRLFFLNMKDKNRSQQDYVEMFRSKAYEQKIKICRGAVKNFLDEHFKKFPVRSLEWDAEQDIFILQEIVKYAQFLARLRGTLMLWKEEGGGGDLQYNFPIIEEPPRAINSLYNLAKGHALIHGRTFLRSEDLELVRAVAFSSMPHDRVEFLRLLMKHEGRLTTQHIQSELNCSDETARKTMKTFEILGVVTLKNLDFSGGRPMYFVEIKPEFTELLKNTQVLNDLEKNNPSETKGVYDNFSAQDFVKLAKDDSNLDRTHLRNDLEKNNPSETNPVLCAKCGTPKILMHTGEWFCEECKS